MSDDLKPCPFCGKIPIIDKERSYTLVGCFREECTMGGAFFQEDSEADAMTAWNTRTDPSAEIIAVLVESLKIIEGIGDGSRTANSLPNIADIARQALARANALRGS